MSFFIALTMRTLALVLAFVARVGHLRRVQTSIMQMHGDPCADWKSQAEAHQSSGKRCTEGTVDNLHMVAGPSLLLNPAAAFVPSSPLVLAGAPDVSQLSLNRHRQSGALGSPAAHLDLINPSIVASHQRPPGGHLRLGHDSQFSMSMEHSGRRYGMEDEAQVHLSKVQTPVKIYRQVKLVKEDNENTVGGKAIDMAEDKERGAQPEFRTSHEKSLEWWRRRDVHGIAGLIGAKFFTHAQARSSICRADAGEEPAKEKSLPSGISLFLCVISWYTVNALYSWTDKLSLKATGGVSGYPITIAAGQFFIGILYSFFLWGAPDARRRPTITFKDYLATLPVAAAQAGLQVCYVLAYAAGTVSFTQIVLSSEPVATALLGTLFYGAKVSIGQWLSLVLVVGGVALASFGEIDFAWLALASALGVNLCAAIGKNESKKLLSTPGISERFGSVGNQYAITNLNSFFFTLPLVILLEGHKIGGFFHQCASDSFLLRNFLFSGLWCYISWELATVTLKKTGALTQSVLSALKRVYVMTAIGLVMQESIGLLKILGCSITIAGVFLYTIQAVRNRQQENSETPVPDH